jgi:uncharacterized protein (DUF2062 family)
MLARLSAVGFITNVVVVVLLWAPGLLPLLVGAIPLTVTVGAIMARLPAPEELSMFYPDSMSTPPAAAILA